MFSPPSANRKALPGRIGQEQMQGSALRGQGCPRLPEATQAFPAQLSILVLSAHMGMIEESRRDAGWPVLPAAEPRADGRQGGGEVVINDSCIKKKQLHLLTHVATSTLPRPRANGLRLGVPCPLGPWLAVPMPTVRCPIKCEGAVLPLWSKNKFQSF